MLHYTTQHSCFSMSLPLLTFCSVHYNISAVSFYTYFVRYYVRYCISVFNPKSVKFSLHSHCSNVTDILGRLICFSAARMVEAFNHLLSTYGVLLCYFQGQSHLNHFSTAIMRWNKMSVNISLRMMYFVGCQKFLDYLCS